MPFSILSTFWLPEEARSGLGDDICVDYPAPAVTGEFCLDETRALLPKYDGVLIGIEPFGKEMIDHGLTGKLKVIGRHGVGCDAVDCDYAGERGVAVVNTPDAVTEPTAELTIALMLAVGRGVVQLDRAIRSSGRCSAPPSYDGAFSTAYGKTLGIIGFGRIGKAVAAKASGLGMTIVYADPFPASAEVEARLGATRLEVDELLARSDVVSLHCPYVPENHHLINTRTIGLMQKHAILVNASRGKMVDEAVLVEALRDKRIKAAALDVYEFEPEITAELLTMDNVVLTPHVGTCCYEARVAMAREALAGMAEYLRGGMPANVFNKNSLKK